MTSSLNLFRRAANVLARLEDAVVFNGLSGHPFSLPGGPRRRFGKSQVAKSYAGSWTVRIARSSLAVPRPRGASAW